MNYSIDTLVCVSFQIHVPVSKILLLLFVCEKLTPVQSLFSKWNADRFVGCITSGQWLLNPLLPKSDLIGFTLSNARRFYSV